MKKCPECQDVYDISYNFCLHDGRGLVDDITLDTPTLIITKNLDLSVTEKIFIPIIETKEFIIEDCGYNQSYNHKIKYPKLQNLGNEYIQNRINTFLKDKFVLANQTYELDEDLPKVFKETSFSTEFVNNDLLSLFAQEYSDFGGAHPVWEFMTYNIDLNSGYIYNYHDLFKKNSDYLSRIPTLICSYLDSEDEKEEKSLKEDFEIEGIIPKIESQKDFDFYITQNNLAFVNLFPMYAMCWCHSRIPYYEIADIIHPEGPLQKF